MEDSAQQVDTGGVEHRQIKAFVANWEILEELVTDVYAKGEIDSRDRDLFGSLKLALKRYYQSLAEELQPFWVQVRVAGKVLTTDPIAELLESPGLSAIISNWDAMSKVPAAREAINLMLVAVK